MKYLRSQKQNIHKSWFKQFYKIFLKRIFKLLFKILNKMNFYYRRKNPSKRKKYTYKYFINLSSSKIKEKLNVKIYIYWDLCETNTLFERKLYFSNM